MNRLWKILLSIFFLFISIPIKIFFYLIRKICQHNKKIIILNAPRIGDVIYALSRSNMINEEIFLSIDRKNYDFAKTLLKNKSISLVTHDMLSVKFMFSNKISSIFMPPLNIYEGKFKFLFLTYFSWKYFIAIANPLSISHRTKFEWWLTIIMYFFSLSQILIWSLKTNIYVYDRSKMNIEQITTQFYKKHFKTIKYSWPELKNKRRKRYILINLYGSKISRKLPVQIIILLFTSNLIEKISIKFIGIRDSEHKLIQSWKQKYLDIDIENLVLKTKLEDIPYLIENAIFVVSAQTSIVHISHILNKNVFVWLQWHNKTPRKKNINWELSSTRFWNWEKGKYVHYINSEKSLINNTLSHNNHINDDEISKFMKNIKSMLQ